MMRAVSARFDLRPAFDRPAAYGGLCVIGLVALAVGAACATTKPAKQRAPAERRESVEGGREASPSRRASDQRPKPWVEQKRPFESDRLGIGEYRVHKQGKESGGKAAQKKQRQSAKGGKLRRGPAQSPRSPD